MDDEEENLFDQEHLEQLKRKRLMKIAYFPCPNEGAQAILIVDVETEEEPLRDAQGYLQYYCPLCHTVTSVDTHGNGVPHKE